MANDSHDETKSIPVSGDSAKSSRETVMAQFLLGIGMVDKVLLAKVKEQTSADHLSSLLDRLVESGKLSNEQRDAIDRFSEVVLANWKTSDGAIDDTVSISPEVSALEDTISHHIVFSPKKHSAAVAFGDYEILEEIAKGGMGVVYKARQTKLNRIVALKMIRSAELADAEQVKRFYTEAEAAAKLTHPGIVPVYDVGEANGQHYFSMAFIDGESLSDRIKRDGPLIPREAARLMKEAAEAVEHAHQSEIVHRDIKPQNLLMDSQGKIQVADFGLAKLMHDGSELTADGQVLGTPAYMPPEQAAGKMDEVGGLADVYSLGATLYFLLTGRPPFQAANVHDTLRQVIEKEPVPPRVLDSSIPKDIETICLKALRKESDQRYQSAKEFSEDLLRWLDDKPITARPVGRLERVRKWTRRNPVIAGSAFAMAMTAVVVVLALSIMRRQNMHERMLTAISSLEATQGAGVAFALEDLENHSDRETLRELQERFPNVSKSEKLCLAYGLAHYGDVRVNFLVNELISVSTLPAELMNLVAALGSSKQEALARLVSTASDLTAEESWKLKARVAIVAIHLGESAIASEMLQGVSRVPGPFDPIQRTRFIAEFPNWCGNLASMARVVGDVDNRDFRSGIALAAGRVVFPAEAAKESWGALLREWYLEAMDGGTHGAARFAMRQWGLPVPKIAAANSPQAEREWWKTPSGLSMVRIPKGNVIGSNMDDKFVETSLDKEFWLSDREVSAALFMKFVNDASYLGPKPIDWNVEYVDLANENVAHSVSWYDAVMFCNWLSKLEGRSPYYNIVNHRTRGQYKVTLIADGTGYRLPTEVEWEFACRATTTTLYACGDWTPDLKDYCIYNNNSNRRVAPAATRPCNPWGLFDMHGNLWEFCWETYLENDSPPPQSPRVNRGGSCLAPASGCRSSIRSRLSPNMRTLSSGIRVALNCSGS